VSVILRSHGQGVLSLSDQPPGAPTPLRVSLGLTCSSGPPPARRVAMERVKQENSRMIQELVRERKEASHAASNPNTAWQIAKLNNQVSGHVGHLPCRGVRRRGAPTPIFMALARTKNQYRPGMFMYGSLRARCRAGAGLEGCVPSQGGLSGLSSRPHVTRRPVPWRRRSRRKGRRSRSSSRRFLPVKIRSWSRQVIPQDGHLRHISGLGGRSHGDRGPSCHVVAFMGSKIPR